MATSVQIVFDCADPDKLATFWAEALHYKKQDPPPGFATWPEFLKAQGIPESEWDSASAVVDPEGVGSRLYFQRVPEGKVVKNRVHLDLNVGGPRGTPLDERRRRVDAEVGRLVQLGARRSRTLEERGEYWVNMFDPEGNEFDVQQARHHGYKCPEDALATFWAGGPHYKKQDPPTGASWEDFLMAQGIPESLWNSASAVIDPDGTGPRIFFQQVPEAKTVQNRVHLDLNIGGGFGTPPDKRRRRVDADRIVRLGGRNSRTVAERGGYFVNMLDPEGNEFDVHQALMQLSTANANLPDCASMNVTL